jgi:hypothetical protein
MRGLVFLSLLFFALAAAGARIEIPLRVPYEPLREALNAKLAHREGPCRYLKAEATKLEALDGRLRLSGPGSAAYGLDCQTALSCRTLMPTGACACRLSIPASAAPARFGASPSVTCIRA